jgi:hypothetical protein
MFKNEAPYLKEWLEHYLNRNIDHFYLINDCSTDNYIEILNKYSKYITLFNVDETISVTGRQIYFYNKFFRTILDKTAWIGVFDIDEYVWSPYSYDFKKCANFLNQNHIDYYRIPMVLFGSNKRIEQPKEIVNSFTKRINFDKEYLKFILQWWQYKNVAKANKIISFKIHDYETVDSCNKIFQNNLDLNKNLFRLNHYRLQSKNKWENNLNKSDINLYIPPSSENLCPNVNIKLNNNPYNYRTMDLFYEADKHQNQIEDLDLIYQNKCNSNEDAKKYFNI